MIYLHELLHKIAYLSFGVKGTIYVSHSYDKIFSAYGCFTFETIENTLKCKKVNKKWKSFIATHIPNIQLLLFLIPIFFTNILTIIFGIYLLTNIKYLKISKSDYTKFKNFDIEDELEDEELRFILND